MICPRFSVRIITIFKRKKLIFMNTVVFDMDGTVLNTLEDLTVSVNYALAKYHLPERDPMEYRAFFGNGIRYAIQCAAPDGIPEELLDKLVSVYRDHYNAHCLDHTRPYDGILDLMKNLKNQDIRMAIVSNKIDSAVKELTHRFFSEYVDVAIGERKGIRRKPAPDTVLTALDILGSKKEDSVYVGDSEVDIQTAQNAGIPCLSVLWGFRDRDLLIKNGATTLVRKPEEILYWQKKVIS